MSGNGFSTRDREMEVHLEAMLHSSFCVTPDVLVMKKTNNITCFTGKGCPVN
jgi:hypothetical protein